MSEPAHPTRAVIPQALMLKRVALSEQMREFFIRMWLENPELARQAGAKIRAMLAPLPTAAPEKQEP